MTISDLDGFKDAIKKYGFDTFWSLFIQSYLHEKRPDLISSPSKLKIDFRNNIFSFENLGELYEIGLAYDNQISKKQLGQYYTPMDTCQFMANKTIALFNPESDCLADVCCGTGNLIIEVLTLLGKNTASKIIKKGKLYLYDLDKNAIKLAIMKISILFIEKNDLETFQNISNLIHINIGNFLSDNIHLPKNMVVISNPPYGKMSPNIDIWPDCKTSKTKEMYAVFMDKIATESKNAVIISQQSFLGGSKFSSLRAVLSKYGGAVYSFDNIPCPIFIGRKKGIFNTNTSNSVRAAITVIDKSKDGFRVSPMIRFKMQERAEMFAQLDNLLGNFVYKGTEPWTKIPKSLEPLVLELKNATKTVNDLIEKNTNLQQEHLRLTIPSTPRYFITGSRRNLMRGSKIVVYAKDEESFEKLYVMLNSTFSYLWWRIYDGGITLTNRTLLSMPIPDLETSQIKDLVTEGLSMENRYIINKMNAGRNNENIKFPEDYRKKVNQSILNTINATNVAEALYSVHFNNLTSVLPLWAAD